MGLPVSIGCGFCNCLNSMAVPKLNPIIVTVAIVAAFNLLIIINSEVPFIRVEVLANSPPLMAAVSTVSAVAALTVEVMSPMDTFADVFS